MISFNNERNYIRVVKMEKIKQIEGKVKKKFEQLKDTYDRSWDPDNHSLHVGIFFHEDDTLQKSFNNSNLYLKELAKQYKAFDIDSKILDVCTGTGRTLIEFTEEYGCTAVGLDISKEAIKDARLYNNGKCTFIIGSASEFNLKEKFTHAISQDGIFLVGDKRKCLQSVYDALEEGGIFLFSDFLAERTDLKLDRKKNVYGTVKWEKGVSFKEYLELLKKIGFKVLHSERRKSDMLKTYQKLISQTEFLLRNDPKMFKTLVERYKAMVKSIEEDELNWGWFVVKK